MKILRKLRSLFRKEKLETEMAEEMRHHVELQTELNVKAGMRPDDARYAALRQFGNVASVQEQCRERWPWAWAEQWGRDLRFSIRSLRHSIGFSLAVILTLALCIGANTTIMSVLYELILKPLPFRDAGQLVEVYNSQLKSGQEKKLASVAQYLDFKAHADHFEGFALWKASTFNIGEDSDPTRGIGASATADLFHLLGVQPLLGRFFTMEECMPGKDNVLVVPQSYWEGKFHSDPSVIGRVIQLSGEPFTIIGVAPRRLESFNVDAILIKPMAWPAQRAVPQARPAFDSKLYARLKPGVAGSTGLAQLEVLENRFRETVADPQLRDFIDRSGQRMELGQIRVEQTKSVRSSLLLLQGGALFVLLLGCVNVAGLMLARANARQAELAIRQALGAGRWALARQLLIEGAVLTTGGAITGLALTWFSLGIINTYTVNIVREVHAVVIDGTVLGLTVLVSLLVAALIALLPVWRLWRTELQNMIQGGSRTASGGVGVRTVSGWLVAAQIALALVLLIGAGLLLRSFANVMAINPGFDARHVVHGRVAFNASYVRRENAQAVQNQILAKMREIPGVASISYSSHMPVTGGFSEFVVPIRGSVLGKDDTFPRGAFIGVSPGFFPTMGIRLLEGRDFTEADLLPNARRVFIVDRRFAERYFPGRSAVGETFAFGPPGQKPEEAPVIIGVSDEARLNGLEERDDAPFIFGALAVGNGGFSIELRTDRRFEEIVPLMRALLRSVDPALPLYQVCVLQMNLDGAAADRRGVMWLLGAFAGIALVLSAIGIYGMLAYDVAQRTREIGIRAAIGATRGQILTMIIRQGLGKAVMGLVAGLFIAFYLSRYMGSLLYGVKPTDPLAFFGVSLLLLLVALLASWLPARRAAKIDPVIALRAE